jgi:hypothetical protein
MRVLSWFVNGMCAGYLATNAWVHWLTGRRLRTGRAVTWVDGIVLLGLNLVAIGILAWSFVKWVWF